jgi:hypothetical protein
VKEGSKRQNGKDEERGKRRMNDDETKDKMKGEVNLKPPGYKVKKGESERRKDETKR